MTARQYKQFKGLKKENLRDNMTNKELVLNMLAELSTKEISESNHPETFEDHKEAQKISLTNRSTRQRVFRIRQGELIKR